MFPGQLHHPPAIPGHGWNLPLERGHERGVFLMTAGQIPETSRCAAGAYALSEVSSTLWLPTSRERIGLSLVLHILEGADEEGYEAAGHGHFP